MFRSQPPVKKKLKSKEVIKPAVWCQITDTSRKNCPSAAIWFSILFIPSVGIPQYQTCALKAPQNWYQTNGKCLAARQHCGKNRTQKQAQISSFLNFKLKTFSLKSNHSFASQFNVTWPWTSWAAWCCCFSFLSAVMVCTVCVQSLAFNCLLLPISFVNK